MSKRYGLVIQDLLLIAVSLVVCVLLGKAIQPLVNIHRINIAMIFVLGVIVVATYRRTKAGYIMPIIAMATFIYVFVPPEYHAIDYSIAWAIMIVIAMLISYLAERIRQQGIEVTRAAMVIEQEKLRNTLLNSISHDLRTPLTAIAGAASSLMVADKVDEATRKELSESIYRQSQRLNRILGNLLDMTRVESETFKIKAEWNSIEEIVGAALLQLERETVERSITTDFPADLPLIMMDDTLIEQVLVNLLDNAVKYAPEDKSIHVWARAETDHVVVGVDSNGIVLPETDLQKLFEKFYRGSNVGTAHGAGLGLPICKAIIALHSGNFSVKQLAQALSFQFTLPVGAAVPTLREQVEIND